MTAIFVLTGGPCSGKSTAIAGLERRGHAVIHEAAREVILEGKLHPARDPLEFQREVLRRQIRSELSVRGGPVFADRGIGDHFGYLEYYRKSRGIEIAADFLPELEAAWKDAAGRYAAVLLLGQNPVFSAEVYRRETAEEAKAIHDALAASYRSRHPRVIDIPWMPPGERADLILARAGLRPP